MNDKDEFHAALRDLIARYYARGVARVLNQYGKQADLSAEAQAYLDARMAEVDVVFDHFIDTLTKKMELEWERVKKNYADEQMQVRMFTLAVEEEIHKFITVKLGAITQFEMTAAEFAGSGNAISESGMGGYYYFPHLGDDDECQLCEQIRENAPYTVAEAEKLEMPLFPHVNCDHSWLYVPENDPEALEHAQIENAKRTPFEWGPDGSRKE